MSDISLSALGRSNGACDRFVEAWLAGGRPRVAGPRRAGRVAAPLLYPLTGSSPKGRRLVAATGPQRPGKDEPSRAAAFRRCQVAPFRLDRAAASDTLEGFEEKRPPQATSPKALPEGSPT
jgi:hypothetical protein